jgi:DNA-binding NarL/FixJ family response regulator
VYVSATDEVARARVLALLGRTRIALAAEPGRPAETVILSAGGTVDDAMMRACRAACLPAGHRLLLAADTFPAAGVIRAVQAGVHAMVRLTGATPAQLAAAVLSAHRGDGRLPPEAMAQLLAHAARPLSPPSCDPALPRRTEAIAVPLTARQIAVLSLMADGHGNAAIARALSCSEHTVKNIIYDMTARLQVRNRAHAVAFAISAKII